MPEFVERLRESDLIEDFQNGGMDSVATKVTVEIFVCLQQRDPNAFSRQQQREHHAARPASDYAASGLL
jgi:hypothetical protein